jgi:fumarate reductase subunit D
MVAAMKPRSNAPVFWLLFGAGGMLSALLGAALVAVTGLAVPLAGDAGAAWMSHGRMLAMMQNVVGKSFVFAVIALFAWHAAHRILCSLHDVGIHKGAAAKGLCYGAALSITLVAGAALLSLGV